MSDENIEPQCGYAHFSLTTIIISMNILKYPVEVSNSSGKTYYKFHMQNVKYMNALNTSQWESTAEKQYSCEPVKVLSVFKYHSN